MSHSTSNLVSTAGWADGAPFNPVVIAPTYNNAGSLVNILNRIAALSLPMIVIDDGSTDSTPQLLSAWLSHGAGGENADIPSRPSTLAADDSNRRDVPPPQVLTHGRNRGKAAALRSGFASATARGFTHAVTIDTDGQLYPEQIPDLLAVAARSRQALILGARDETASDYPARSRVGRRASNLMVRIESGLRVSDSQCGLRVYPLELLNAVRCRAGRYGFETEVITRAGWAGCQVLDVPVTCHYFPAAEHVSHFRPWVDSFRGVGLHLRLAARAMVPWPPPPRWPIRPRPSRPNLRTVIRGAWSWVNPMEALRQLRRDRVNCSSLAAGLAIGAFIANLPAYGLQTAISLYTARRLHLHPVSVVLGSHLSTPPVGPILIAAAIGTGHLLLHGSWLRLADLNLSTHNIAKLFGSLLLEWTVGGLLIGFVSMVVVFFTTYGLMCFTGKGARQSGKGQLAGDDKSC